MSHGATRSTPREGPARPNAPALSARETPASRSPAPRLRRRTPAPRRAVLRDNPVHAPVHDHGSACPGVLDDELDGVPVQILAHLFHHRSTPGHHRGTVRAGDEPDDTVPRQMAAGVSAAVPKNRRRGIRVLVVRILSSSSPPPTARADGSIAPSVGKCGWYTSRPAAPSRRAAAEPTG